MPHARDHGAARAIPSPSRRTLMAGASAALVAAAAIASQAKGDPAKPGQPMPAFPAPAGDDAELIALADQFWRHEAAVSAWDAGRLSEAEGKRHHEVWWNCCRAMTGITPQTEAGRSAKAAVALVALEKVADPSSDAEVLARTVLADLGGRPQTDPAPDPDADLIALCNRVAAIRREERLICIADPWAPDKGPHHARYEALWTELHQVQDRIYDLDGPTTLAGMRAVAEAALFTVDRTRDGDLTPKDIDDWLLLSLATYHAGPAFEAEVRRLVTADNHPEARA